MPKLPSALVGWLVARPCASHAVIAALEVLALTAAMAGLFAASGVAVPHAPIIAALIVSAFYYDREAGQHEHDLKNRGTGPLLAFAGSEFGFLWSLDNLTQWLSAAGASAAAALALTLAGL